MSTCYELMIANHRKNGKVVYYGHEISMSQFVKDVDSLASGLSCLGIGFGDVVTVYLPTCPQSVAAFYACSKLGAVASFVHPLTPLDELSKNIEITQSKALLFYDVLVKDEKDFCKLNVALVRCSIADYVTLRKPAFALYARTVSRRAKNVILYSGLLKTNKNVAIGGSELDVVCYMHSGGTGGQPKIVKLTNYAFNSTSTTILDMYKPNLANEPYYLVTLPVFHAYGLCASVHTGFVGGLNLALVPQFNVKTVNKYFNKYNVLAWCVVPAMLTKMLRANSFVSKGFSRLDVIYCGGDVLQESLAEQVDSLLAKFGTRAKVMRGYGLTETCGVCAVNNYDYYAKGSCGKPIEGCRVEIWDENDKPLPPMQRGEIVLTAKGLMSGYLEGDENRVKNGNWIKTGDIGYVDEQGFLYVVDRKKRMVKIAAVNVFPSEVESCIAEIPFVKEVCVTPYRRGGKYYLKAWVTINQPVSANEVERQIIDFCQKRLIKYSVPRFVQILDVMPRTKLAKIDYKELERRSIENS